MYRRLTIQLEEKRVFLKDRLLKCSISVHRTVMILEDKRTGLGKNDLAYKVNVFEQINKKCFNKKELGLKLFFTFLLYLG